MSSMLLVVNKAPYGYENVFSSFYLAIACLDRGNDVDVLLIEDGVYAAMKNQDSERAIRYPNVSELAYLIFPQGKIFVHIDSMMQRGIESNDLIDIVEVVDDEYLYKISKAKDNIIKT